MLPAARHDVLVIADSDVHARPDYLERLVDALQEPDVGLVTTLYAGLPALPLTLAGRLGATQITHGFLPGAVLARWFGRQDCLGATMCLRRHDLARIGGAAHRGTGAAGWPGGDCAADHGAGNPAAGAVAA
jgi:ceramide glucosyltransferase